MLTSLRLRNFKSWEDTRSIGLSKLTCIFGSNSSGKTSILQSLLLLKQTVDSPDRGSVLRFGGPGSYVNLGDYTSVVHLHDVKRNLGISLSWIAAKSVRLLNPAAHNTVIVDSRDMSFETNVSAYERAGKAVNLGVSSFSYKLGSATFLLARQSDRGEKYDLYADAPNFDLMRTVGRPWPLPSPSKCYGFPDQVKSYFQNAGMLSDLELQFEDLLRRVYYLGPLRASLERTYSWAGGQPVDMGRAGELAVDAILAARDRDLRISLGRGIKRLSVEAYVAEWLKRIGLIESFSVSPVSEDSQIFQVRVRKTANAPEVLITDVGFGVSQILPVLVLCFYVPEGSIILLEQPEIHLHPAVQAGLADVLIDACQKRSVQIILESHSEHLLRRLQRRIAEASLSSRDVRMYFCTFKDDKSALTDLEIDLFGNVTNWPKEFFGDMMGELAATQEARRVRMRKDNK